MPNPFLRLDSARKRLLDSVKDMSEDEMNAIVHGDWTVKDILYHIASWDRESRKACEWIASGAKAAFDYVIAHEDSFKEWNEKEIRKGRKFSLAEVKKMLEKERMGLKRAAVGLTNRKLKEKFKMPWGFVMSAEEILLIQAKHDIHHTRVIKRQKRILLGRNYSPKSLNSMQETEEERQKGSWSGRGWQK